MVALALIASCSPFALAKSIQLEAAPDIGTALVRAKVDAKKLRNEIDQILNAFWLQHNNPYLIRSFYAVDPLAIVGKNAGTYYLSLNYANTDHLQVIVVSSKGEIRVETMGDEVPYNGRSVSYRLPTLAIDVPSTTLVIFQALDTVATNFDLRLRSADQHYQDLQSDYVFYGLYFGVLAFLIAASFILLLFTRDPSFFWYASYLLSAVVFLLITNGLGQSMVWPDSSNLTRISFWGSCGMAVSITLFAYNFLGLQGRSQFFVISNYLVLTLIIATSLSLLFVHHGAVDETFYLLASYQMAVVFWLAVKSHLEGNEIARYLVLGYLVLFPALGIAILKFSGFIAPTDLANRSVELAFLVEALIFSYGLGMRLQHLVKDKLSAERTILANRKTYLSRLIETRENEKRDMGALLHNSVAQTLALGKTRLIQLAKKGQSAEINQIGDLVDQAMQRVRDISHSTYPHILDQLGLDQAISQYAQIHLDPNEIDWRCTVDRVRLDEQQQLFLYRIIQECINNVVRHSQASMVLISLRANADGGIGVLNVEDDGSGFDAHEGEGFGLATTREYAEALGGKLQITSTAISGNADPSNFLVKREPQTNQIIYLVDDHPLYRSGTKALLADNGYESIFEFETIEKSSAALEDNPPAVIFLDLELPDGSGLAAASTFVSHRRQPRVIILTTHKEISYVKHAQAIGAHGYLFKDDDPILIVDCLHALKKRESFFMSPQVKSLLESQDDSFSIAENRIEDLTRREQHVLYLLACDMTSKEIGSELNLSFRTVQNHRANIKSKFLYKRNSQLLKFADKHKSQLAKLFA